jgi:hypothetical protein
MTLKRSLPDAESRLHELRGTPFSQVELNQIVKEEVAATAVADCVVAVSDAEKRAEAHGVERVHVLGRSYQLRLNARLKTERDFFSSVPSIRRTLPMVIRSLVSGRGLSVDQVLWDPTYRLLSWDTTLPAAFVKLQDLRFESRAFCRI